MLFGSVYFTESIQKHLSYSFTQIQIRTRKGGKDGKENGAERSRNRLGGDKEVVTSEEKSAEVTDRIKPQHSGLECSKFHR